MAVSRCLLGVWISGEIDADIFIERGKSITHGGHVGNEADGICIHWGGTPMRISDGGGDFRSGGIIGSMVRAFNNDGIAHKEIPPNLARPSSKCAQDGFGGLDSDPCFADDLRCGEKKLRVPVLSGYSRDANLADICTIADHFRSKKRRLIALSTFGAAR